MDQDTKAIEGSRIEFPIYGKYTEEFYKSKGPNSKPNRVGKIIGESKDGTCYRIIWPGTLAKKNIHKSFIEIVESGALFAQGELQSL